MTHLRPPHLPHRTPAQWTALILCALILVAAMTAMYVRCSHTVLLADDLFYRFILPPELIGTPNLGPEIQSWTDAFRSQYNQYFHTNGRFWIHVVIQMLSANHPGTAYPLCSALIAGLTILTLIVYTVARTSRTNPLLWILAAVTLFYLFPSPDWLWYEVATGMNYLLPMPFVLCWLICFRDITNVGDTTCPPLKMVALCLLSFFTGWSQETFAIPLSGALLLFVILNRRKLNIAIMLPVCVLWIGAAFLALSPNNFNRVGGGSSILNHIKNGFNLYFQIKILWCAAILTVIAWFRNRALLKEQMRRYSIVWYALIVAVPFGLIANTFSQSFTGIEFYSCIAIFTLIPALFPIPRTPGWGSSVCAGILLVLFSVHQYLLCRQAARIERHTLQFINDYRKDDDGFMTLPAIEMLPFTDGWVNQPLIRMTNWATFSICMVYGHNAKPISVLSDDEMLIFTHPDRFLTRDRRVSGSAEIYRGDSRLWRKGAHTDTIVMTIIRADSHPAEKLINRLTGSKGKSFTAPLKPERVIPLPGGDTVTTYSKPGFQLVRIDTLNH